MQKITLGDGGRETTRLGFGCSSVMGSMGRRDSLAMLEAAYAAGIRHFDVAPSYGFGEAERCLGEFLKRHPWECTVTTKYGIAPGRNGGWKGALRGVVRPVLKLLPGLKKGLQGAVRAGSTPAPRGAFTPEGARVSLRQSLENLGLECVDLLLLHEAAAQDLEDPGLLDWLEEQVKVGTIGSFGIGSEAEKIRQIAGTCAGRWPVLQYEWSVLDAMVEQAPPFRIHHRALTENFRALHAALRQDGPRCRRWSDFCGVDLDDAEKLASLMLKAALVCNPQSIILFSSKRPEHIRANSALADDGSRQESALRLYSLVRSETHALAPAGTQGAAA